MHILCTTTNSELLHPTCGNVRKNNYYVYISMVRDTIIITRIIKNMKEYVGIYIKTKKAQEQDGFGNK